MIAKKYVFCSPKSGGSTLCSFNMAIQNQFLERDQRIAYLQLSHFPDVSVYGNISAERTIFDIKNFLDKKEFPANLLSKVAQKNGVDFFQSPKKSDWENLSANDLQKIINILSEEYDVLFVDLSLELDEKIIEYCFGEAQKIIIVSFLAPPNLAAMESFLQAYEKFLPKFSLLFNQCPSGSASLVRKKIENREIDFLGTLPIEKRHMWEQVFEAHPLAFQKKSKWSRALLLVLKKVI